MSDTTITELELTDYITPEDFMVLDRGNKTYKINPSNIGGFNVDSTIYVSIDGNDELNTGKTSISPFKTIKKACKFANDNFPKKYTILVYAGEYLEENPIVLPENTALIGNDSRTVVIKPKNTTYDILWVNNSCYVYGITFKDYTEPSSAITFPKYETFDDEFDKAYNTLDLDIIIPTDRPIITNGPQIRECNSNTKGFTFPLQNLKTQVYNLSLSANNQTTNWINSLYNTISSITLDGPDRFPFIIPNINSTIPAFEDLVDYFRQRILDYDNQFDYYNINNYFSKSPAMHIYNRLPSDYSLMKSTPSVTEGGSVTITLNTINIPNFINVPYTVTGVSSDDINGASLKGNFYINNNTASVTFNIKGDAFTENTEILTLSLDNGKASVSVNILDNNPTYSLSTNASVQTINNLNYYVVNENQSVTITLNTRNVANSTNVPYNIIGVSSDDINGASLTGNFYINNNTASVTFNIKGDAFTENTEILTLEIPTKAINILIFINDTSKTGCIRTSGNWVITGKVAICESVTVNGHIFISNGATLWIKYPAHLTQPDNFDIHVQEGSGGLYATGTLSGGVLYVDSSGVYLDRPPPDYVTFSCADIC
jgi:uncharacterized protein YxjI